jgi:arsenate reductase
LRQKGTPCDEFGFGDAKWSDDDIVEAMLEHTVLINEHGVRVV